MGGGGKKIEACFGQMWQVREEVIVRQIDRNDSAKRKGHEDSVVVELRNQMGHKVVEYVGEVEIWMKV